MSNNDLFTPEKMLEEQAHIQSKMERGEYSENQDLGDFGAYYALKHNLPMAEKWIQAHGLSGQVAELYVANFKNDCTKAHCILDVGCGAGFITNALKKAHPQAEVMGIDLALDGIEFAKESFKECSFMQIAVDEKLNLNRTFDVVHVREFYPFTRIDDWDMMRDILKALLKHVSPGGTLIVINATPPHLMAHNLFRYYDRINTDPLFVDYKISRHRMSRIKVMERLGTGIAARIGSYIADVLIGNPTTIMRMKSKG